MRAVTYFMDLPWRYVRIAAKVILSREGSAATKTSRLTGLKESGLMIHGGGKTKSGIGG